MKRNTKFDEQVARIAQRIECGFLLAATNSAAFMEAVADLLDSKDAEIKQLRDELDRISQP